MKSETGSKKVEGDVNEHAEEIGKIHVKAAEKVPEDDSRKGRRRRGEKGQECKDGKSISVKC